MDPSYSLLLCPILFCAGTVYVLWRISRPWDYRPRPLFSWGRRTAEDEGRPDQPATTRVKGYARLSPHAFIEADLTDWQVAPRQTFARMSPGPEGTFITETVDPPIDEGELIFHAPDGQTRLIVTAFARAPNDTEHLKAAGTALDGTGAHPAISLFAGKELLVALGPRAGLVLAFHPAPGPIAARVVRSLRPIAGVADDVDPHQFLQVRLANDGQLADVLEATRDDVAFDTLAPGLHVLYVETRGGPKMRVLGPEEVERIGRERLLARMATHVPPELSLHAVGGKDVLTNTEFHAAASMVVLQPAFQARVHHRLGERVLVGVPSFSRLFVARDTPRNRQALTQILRVAAPQVEEKPLSSRVYRLEKGRWGVADLVE